MHLDQIVSTYGYLAVLIGTFLEGETILIIAGLLAHQGYLDLPWVVAAAFVGSTAGDQLFFSLGRQRGIAALERRPRWRRAAATAQRLLVRHQIWLILGFRFLYGLRTVTPFLLGASGIKPIRFLVLNIIGALIWAVSFGVLGYVVGETLQALVGKIKRLELLVVVIVVSAGLLIALFVRWRQMMKRSADDG
ncbi:MAG TPA: DedA family protein [Burkholderiales bacterium]|nr:DedA family protein [Burkholderiales bacterium]